MFINFDNSKHMLRQPMYPPDMIQFKDFPVLLDEAKRMHASLRQSHGQEPRFALLKLWSAPHFYPLMIGIENRPVMAFVDSMKRGWEFKFIPKDYTDSEWSIHFSVKARLERVFLLQPDLCDWVAHRGDAILVAGKDELELFRHAFAITLALTTKPWFREIDLWRSYINTDLEGIERADGWGWLELGG